MSLALLLASALASASPTQAGAKPAAAITRDEGGPVRVTDRMSYTAPAIETRFKEPVVALLDFSHSIQGNYREFVPRSGQILGTLTSPLAPFGPRRSAHRGPSGPLAHRSRKSRRNSGRWSGLQSTTRAARSRPIDHSHFDRATPTLQPDSGSG